MKAIRCRHSLAPGALLALLLPLGALASEAATAPLPGSARAFTELQQTAASDAGRRLEKGRAALDGMRFAEAVILLTEAIEFYRTADLQKHHGTFSEAQGLLAAAHLFAGDEAEARNTLRGLFTVDEHWDLPAEQRSPELGQLIDAVRAELGSLQRGPLMVSSTPEGATVSLDGRALGKTPLTTDPILPGRHVIALDRKGSVPRQAVVFVGPSTRLEWSLGDDPEAALAALPAQKPRTFWGKHRGKVFLGTAGLGAGATVVLLWQARSTAADAALIPQVDSVTYEAQAQKARALNTGGNAAFYFTAATAVLGTYFLLRDGGKGRPVQAAVAPLPGGAAVTVGGRF